MRYLVTGGCGFIGSNFIHLLLKIDREAEAINLDKLTYAGNPENLKAVEHDPRYRFVQGDIADPACVEEIFRQQIDVVVNFAAESHVDRSILEPDVFIRTNVLGTQTLLEASRNHGVERFIQISTDEVYGSLGPTGKFTERTPLDPSSPYSAGKAGADLLVGAFHRTFGLPAVITRCSNNYGPYQFPEKLIPLFVTNALNDEPLPLYGDGLNVRDWIHVDDHNRAVLRVIEKGKPGEVYNIGADGEKTNVEITRLILKELGKPESLVRKVKDRPGHDRRYAMDATKIRRELGWKPEVSFEQGIRDTIRWYQRNTDWWERVKSGAYRRYYEKQYGKR
jgi:dTDP-glucose 4,6-dehydratase